MDARTLIAMSTLLYGPSWLDDLHQKNEPLRQRREAKHGKPITPEEKKASWDHRVKIERERRKMRKR